MTDIDPGAKLGIDDDQVEEAKENLRAFLDSLDDGVRRNLSAAVTVAGDRSGDLRTRVEEIGQRTAAVAEPVLDSVEDHIEDNDIDVIISGNEIHVEGDEAGVKKVDADIREVLSEGVHIEYDREEGITLAIDDEPE
ncbi:hypothetical protein BRC85_01570 [Halobacteriales archaeon QS_1_69_70]|nr:MAG: hypothetical protein BRC85_01570 [Halobacteriales archaeon QS_1_69_70]